MTYNFALKDLSSSLTVFVSGLCLASSNEIFFSLDILLLVFVWIDRLCYDILKFFTKLAILTFIWVRSKLATPVTSHKANPDDKRDAPSHYIRVEEKGEHPIYIGQLAKQVFSLIRDRIQDFGPFDALA